MKSYWESLGLKKKKGQRQGGLGMPGFRGCTKAKEPAKREETRKCGVRKAVGRHCKERVYLCHTTTK